MGISLVRGNITNGGLSRWRSNIIIRWSRCWGFLAHMSRLSDSRFVCLHHQFIITWRILQSASFWYLMVASWSDGAGSVDLTKPWGLELPIVMRSPIFNELFISSTSLQQTNSFFNSLISMYQLELGKRPAFLIPLIISMEANTSILDSGGECASLAILVQWTPEYSGARESEWYRDLEAFP